MRSNIFVSYFVAGNREQELDLRMQDDRITSG